MVSSSSDLCSASLEHWRRTTHYELWNCLFHLQQFTNNESVPVKLNNCYSQSLAMLGKDEMMLPQYVGIVCGHVDIVCGHHNDMHESKCKEINSLHVTSFIVYGRMWK